MPPIRRRSARQLPNGVQPTQAGTSGNDTASLRRQCAENGLPSHGWRNVLISRLQQHAARPTSTGTAANPSLPSTSTSPQTEETRPPLFTEEHLAQIQSIVTRSVEQSVATIATNAARAAVEAMSSTPQQANDNTNPVVLDEIAVNTANPSAASSVEFQPTLTTNNVPYGNGFHEVPAPYVKKIQAGEFFDLSKLLPKNMFSNNQSEDAIISTLENSVIKAKKASQPTATITDIEQWTTAFKV